MNARITIRDISGFCPEEAVWKMMADVSTLLLKDKIPCFLTPDSVMVDGNTFVFDPNPVAVGEFLAPEQNGNQEPKAESLVWALGAVAYFMATGHVIFGGHGGRYQKIYSSVSLPFLPKGFQALTPLLQKCLCYCPDERVSLKNLNVLSLEGLNLCDNKQREEPVVVKTGKNSILKSAHERWPEAMVEK